MSTGAAAVGVAAGTPIENIATVSYFSDGNTSLQQSEKASTSFVVDELIDVVVTPLDTPAVITPTPARQQVLSFRVTNTGNGTETFRLDGNDLLSADNFNPSLQKIYIESNGIPGLQDGDTLYIAGSNDLSLNADASANVYITADIPANLNTNDLGKVALQATSTTQGISAITQGKTLNQVGDQQTDVVTALDYGAKSAIGTFRVSPVQVTLEKSILSIEDPYGGNEPIPQSKVTYQIKVQVTGSGESVEDLLIQDPTPEHMNYQRSSLTLDGALLSDTHDADKGDFSQTLDNALTVNLGTLKAPATHTITATYIIN